MRYAVIKHRDLGDLVAHVNASIRDRWTPVGGVAYGPEGYAQAMTTNQHDGKGLPLAPLREYAPTTALGEPLL